jgi:hypothetical protein
MATEQSVTLETGTFMPESSFHRTSRLISSLTYYMRLVTTRRMALSFLQTRTRTPTFTTPATPGRRTERMFMVT